MKVRYMIYYAGGDIGEKQTNSEDRSLSRGQKPRKTMKIDFFRTSSSLIIANGL